MQVITGNIIEENHYYSYGLKIAAISSKKLGNVNEGMLKNNYLYQGAYSELDDDIGWHDFYLRNYDAQIGRWIQQDPYQQFASPYLGMGNDPINNTDPSGGIVPIGGGLSTTAATAITLGEVVIKSVSHTTKAVSTISSLSRVISITNISLNIAINVANVINTSITTDQVGAQVSGNPGQPPTKVSDYSYAKLEAGWFRRRNGQKIINQEKTLKDLKGQNTCAIRFSYAANDAGYPIPPKVSGIKKGRIRVGKEGDEGNYILAASEVKTYLEGIEKPTVVREHIKTKTDVDKLIADIHDKTSYGRAIVVIVAGNPAKYEASGHVDLLYRDFMQDISMYGNYGKDLGPYLKEPNHLASDLSVYVWRISK